MSEVTYNGVTIKDVLTHSVNQEPVYDESGQVDQIYVKTVVTVQFTFHTVSGAGLGFDAGAQFASGVKVALRQLTTNRRRFTMTVGGQTLFDVSPGAVAEGAPLSSGGDPDVDNGPRPSLKIDEIIGTDVARGTFTVELAVPSCGNPSTSGVTSLRWWTNDDIDQNWYTTRTISGRLRVANKDVGPHSMRGLIFPPLQQGFRRERMSFTEDPNGLALDFTITDLEVYRSAPSPASTWRGNHRMSSQTPGATVVESEVSVELTGAHDVPQSELVLLGIKIIDNKLQLKEQNVVGGGGTSAEKAKAWILFYAIDAALHENRVSVVCRIKHTGQGKGFSFLSQAGPQFAQGLPGDVTADGSQYDVLKSRLLDGPTAPLTTIMINRLQTPCGPDQIDTAVDTRVERNPSAEEGDGEKPKIEESEEPIPPDPPSEKITQEHKDAPYSNFKTFSFIDEDVNGAPMSIADDSSTSRDDAAFVVFGSPITKRIVQAEASRIGERPRMPKPLRTFQDSKGKVYFLLRTQMLLPSSREIAGGTQEHTVKMRIEYLVNNNYDLDNDAFEQIEDPWLESEAQDTTTPPSIFQLQPVPD